MSIGKTVFVRVLVSRTDDEYLGKSDKLSLGEFIIPAGSGLDSDLARVCNEIRVVLGYNCSQCGAAEQAIRDRVRQESQ